MTRLRREPSRRPGRRFHPAPPRAPRNSKLKNEGRLLRAPQIVADLENPSYEPMHPKCEASALPTELTAPDLKLTLPRHRPGK